MSEPEKTEPIPQSATPAEPHAPPPQGEGQPRGPDPAPQKGEGSQEATRPGPPNDRRAGMRQAFERGGRGGQGGPGGYSFRRRDGGTKPAAPAGPPPRGEGASVPIPPAEPGAEQKPTKVPTLPAEQEFGSGPRLSDLDREIEDELAAAMGELSAEELYGKPASLQRRPAPGTAPAKKLAKVLKVHGTDVFVDVPGGRSGGFLPLLQFPEGPPAVGSEVEVHIEGYDEANGLLRLSRQGAAVEADWSSIAIGMLVEARVTGTNKGGLAVDVNGIRGFLPISQIELFRVENVETYVNQRLKCMVVEVDVEDRNLVVSRRALLEKEREENREKLWNELEEGQVREGTVGSIKDFGAFVDLGGVDGLLHVSEMSWARVQDVHSLLQPGQKVKVVVLKIDRERRKVSLGAKQLVPGPWDNIGENYHAGSVVKATVTRLMDFGAFAELEPGLEGLIHVSELATQRVWRVSDVVKPGQEVQVKVLRIDPQERKIALSLKEAQPKAEEKPAEEAEEEVEVKPPRPRTTPLRGGIGQKWELPGK